MISDEQAQRVAEIVESALELTPEEQRKFVENACSGDHELRREVDSLLRHGERGMRFIQKPAAPSLAAEIWRIQERLPLSIGEYKIISLIGHGGMGDVYLADDANLERRVAVKLVRRGLDTDDVLRRFHHEERVLASLNHPNIAQLHGAGMTSDGLPFFVMEYIEGIRIDEYCARANLQLPARLEVFRKVCAAVQYAHQRLVVHRDIKPSNILVTQDGTPKLLDFGIAKLLEAENNEHTLTAAPIFTPLYASPEHVRGEPATTVSDVYSLGVLLYELLTGQRPYRLRTGRPDEVARAVTRQTPDLPSTTIAGNEKSEIRNQKSLRGDLDNIVLKAMRKEPARRYTSAGQFSEDIRRHLEGLPVMARKDTVAYRTSKFIARNRIAVAAAVLVALAVLAGLIVALWEAQNARQQRDVAEQQTLKAEQISNFLQGILSAASPEEKGKNATVAEVLSDAAEHIDTEFASQPELKAQMFLTIGRTYHQLGNIVEAERTLSRALELNRKLHGEENEATAASMIFLSLQLLNKGNASEAEQLLKKGIAIERKLHIPGNRDIYYALFCLGELYVRKGDYAQATPLLQEALLLADSTRKANNEDSAFILVSMGRAKQFAGDAVGAEEAYRRSIEIFRQLPQRYETRMAMALSNLGSVLTEKGNYDDAIEALTESDRIAQKVGDSIYLLLSRQYLCSVYLKKGDYAKAIEAGKQAVDVGRKLKLESFSTFGTALNDLGLSLTRANRAQEAELYLREALEIRKKTPGSYLTWFTESALGECLTAQKRYLEAEPFLLHGYEGAKAKFGEKHAQTIEALKQLSALREVWPKP